MTISKERPDLIIASKSCHDWTGAYLSGKRPPDEQPTPETCGIFSEPLCHAAVSAAYHESMTDVEKLVSFIPRLIDQTSRKPDGTEWERNWDYCRGLAGLLYILRLVRTWYPSSCDLINAAIHQTIPCILANGPPWIFYGSHTLLGPGHGDMGIVFQIVKCDPSYATHPTIRQVLTHILDQQLENGNWPVAASDAVYLKEEDRERGERQLVQWCHGAPGMVQCLVLLAPYFPDLSDRITTSISRGREFTWQEGLLIKEPNMCHGTSGNAFTFPPGEQRDYFLSFTTEEEVQAGLESGEYEKCDYGIGYSLGFGYTGRAVAWLWRRRDAAKEGRGCYLTFDDL